MTNSPTGQLKQLTPEMLLKALQGPQAKKGFYFNPNQKEMTIPLLESLLINKERYGYLLCPCRLTTGSEEGDKDVLCPCDYRDADVLEYGACYCGLYLSEQEAANHKKEIVVPERRPLEKMFPKK